MRYLNTDLDLVSSAELTELAAALEAHGLFALHVTLCEDGLWRASFETADQYDEAEPNLAALVAAVESLADAHAEQWEACAVRELNSGFECRATPCTLSHSVPTSLLTRVAAVGASLAFTVYVEDDQSAAFPFPAAEPQVH